jgi:hypothetical protein
LTPIGPKDISHETGLERRQVRRALAALEDGGFLERSGERITCYAVPRSSEKAAPVEISKPQSVEFPTDLPDYLLHYLRRFRPAQLPDAAVLEELKPLCSSAVEIESKIRHILKPETEGRNSGASGHTRSKGRTRVSALCSENKNDKPNGIDKIDGMASGVRIERKERKKPLPSSSSSSSENGTMMTVEMAQVSEVLALYCTPELAAVKTLVANCHAQSKGATVAMICDAIHLKGRMSAKKDNPLGFLMVAVPNALTGAVSRPCDCGGTGRATDGYCHCQAGRDLRRAHGR